MFYIQFENCSANIMRRAVEWPTRVGCAVRIANWRSWRTTSYIWHVCIYSAYWYGSDFCKPMHYADLRRTEERIPNPRESNRSKSTPAVESSKPPGVSVFMGSSGRVSLTARPTQDKTSLPGKKVGLTRCFEKSRKNWCYIRTRPKLEIKKKKEKKNF